MIEDDLFFLDEIDKKLLRAQTEFPGMDVYRMGELLGLKQPAICKRMNRPAYTRALAEINKTLFDQLGELQLLAVRRLKSLVQDKDKNLALAAIKIAMAPMINQHTMTFRNGSNGESLYEVKFGENGQIIKGFKDTKELLELDNPATKTT